MKKAQKKQFDLLYQEYVIAPLRQMANTIDVYWRAIRRIITFFDCCPDRLTETQLNAYFYTLIKNHSWSTVTVDRNGLQFFYRHVLNKEWARVR